MNGDTRGEEAMLLRTALEVGDLIADGRRRMRLSQSNLAQRLGVSRQWLSQVENGKTTVEFDLVLAALQALGYALYVQSPEGVEQSQLLNLETHNPSSALPHDSSSRTPLTRKGKPLGVQRSKRRSENAGE